MDELKKEKSKKLRRRLGYAAKAALKSGNNLLWKGKKLLIGIVLFTSVGHTSAETMINASDNGIRVEQSGDNAHSSFVSDVSLSSSVKTMGETPVFETLEECRSVYGSDLNLDVSNVEFSMSDLELAKGKESAYAKKMWQTALTKRTAEGHCTRNSKQTLKALGWVNNLSPEDRAYFEGIVPAWKLIPLLSAGKVGPLREININADELKAKTTPIPLMRVNEAGETVNSHTQFMWDKGAVFGGGVQSSPECHKLKGGRRQWYGKAHFYVDKETLITIVDEVTKDKDDMMLVFDIGSKTATLISLDKVSETHRLVVAQYRTKKNTPVLDNVEALQLTIALTADIKIAGQILNSSGVNTKGKKDAKKVPSIRTAYVKGCGMANG